MPERKSINRRENGTIRATTIRGLLGDSYCVFILNVHTGCSECEHRARAADWQANRQAYPRPCFLLFLRIQLRSVASASTSFAVSPASLLTSSPRVIHVTRAMIHPPVCVLQGDRSSLSEFTMRMPARLTVFKKRLWIAATFSL